MRRSLPSEIWRLIFTDVTHDTSSDEIRRGQKGRLQLNTLFHLCLVSRSFRYYAEPVLYSTFTPCYGHSLIRWAFTILQSPRLAEHVREVELHPFDNCTGSFTYRWDESLATDNIAYYSLFLELAQKLGVIDADAELIYSDLQDIHAEFHGKMWLFLHLLCVKLPNLEKLTMYTMSPPEFPHFWTRSDLAPPHLRELRIEWTNHFEWASRDGKAAGIHIDLSSLGDLLALPKLEKLHLCRFIAGVQHNRLGKDGPSVMHREIGVNKALTRLQCANCLLDQHTLHQIAATFPNLETFEYYTGSFNNSDGVPNAVSGSGLVQALMPLADKLRSLSLDLVGHDKKAPLLQGQRYYIPSLAGFERLEELSVDMMLAVKRNVKQAVTYIANSPTTMHLMEREGDGADFFCNYFPPNLKRLKMIRVDDKIISPLTALSSNVDSWMPKLGEVELRLEAGVIDSMDIVKKGNGEQLPSTHRLTVSNWSVLGRRCGQRGMKGGADRIEVSVDSVVLPLQWWDIMAAFTSRGVGVKIDCVTKCLSPSDMLRAAT